MNGEGYEPQKDAERQSAFSRAVHSIRTRYSLVTGIFLLFCLAVFYVGGRIVLVHLMREAEHQVREIGYDISRQTYRQADEMRQRVARNVAVIKTALKDGRTPAEILSDEANGEISILLTFSETGAFVSGAARGSEGLCRVTDSDLAPYAEQIVSWADALLQTNDTSQAVGILQVCDRSHYVSLIGNRDRRTGFLILGSRFDSGAFTARVNRVFSGLDVQVSDRCAKVVTAPRSFPKDGVPVGEARTPFGISPILSEALNFYSGGFWNLGANPFEAVFAVRDIAGNAVSMIVVSLPATLTNVTRSALGRLSFFIAMAGIFLILPIFWFQSHVLLNPLTRMTAEIRKLGEHHQDVDCPRLVWEGKDEFALLALSVNRMLETISKKAVAVASVETRHRALIGGIPDALMIFDQRGRLVSINKEAEGIDSIPGFIVGEIPDPAVFGEEASAAFVAAVQSTLAQQKAPTLRLKVLPSSVLPVRHFEVRLTRMDHLFALAVIRDVSREVAEHKLRLAAEARAGDVKKRESLTLLAAGLAHDMNNVLSVVLSAAEAKDADPSGDSRHALTTIREAIRRGSSMMRELTTFAGENKMSFLRLSPRTILEDVKILAEHVVGSNIVFAIRPVGEVPDVDADPNQFWKVFFNIVKNAGEAIGGRPGHITLSAEPFTMTEEAAVSYASDRALTLGPGVLFKIEDDGPGIAPELIDRLFDPYVSSKSVGRGLGLATVRTIVEAHNGGLRVVSRVDHGTTFLVFLPQSRLPQTAQTTVAAVSAGKLPSEILVVDDDEAILKMMSLLLKPLKVSVQVARDRTESLAVLRRYSDRIGAIVLDAHFGGVDVVRLLDSFRVTVPGLPVIVCSGSSEEDIQKLFKGHPYDGFLAKPFTLVELKKALLTYSRVEAKS